MSTPAKTTLATALITALGAVTLPTHAAASPGAGYGVQRPVDGRTCAEGITRKMQILHSSDNESSFQDPNTLEEKILNYAAVVDGLQDVARQECIPSAHVTVGDHTIPGPFYLASAVAPVFGAPGRAD
ncbi:MAG TPA: hypothetical protein VLT59_04405, partial [Steroidobacteraceae bacterium]|nr:hypothetical protein [Steroidobacteraceae bacterium]